MGIDNFNNPAGGNKKNQEGSAAPKVGLLRQALLGAAAAAAAVGGLIGDQALAQGKKDQYPPGYDEMLKAARELAAQDQKEKERRKAKPYRDALDVQKKIFQRRGKNNPRHSEYQEELAKKFGITDWTTNEGIEIFRYLNDWYNEN